MKKGLVLLTVLLLVVFAFAGCRDMGVITGRRDYGNVSRTDDGEVNGTNETELIDPDPFDATQPGSTAGNRYAAGNGAGTSRSVPDTSRSAGTDAGTSRRAGTNGRSIGSDGLGRTS